MINENPFLPENLYEMTPEQLCNYRYALDFIEPDKKSDLFDKWLLACAILSNRIALTFFPKLLFQQVQTERRIRYRAGK